MAFNSKGAAVGLLFLVAACVAPQGQRPAPPVVRHVQPPAPPTYAVTGLETVIGRTARYLEGEFGRPDLDIREGQARKLQFSGPACVLDAYLYPPRGGGEPIVTYVDARLPDGRAFDRASCVAALTKVRAP
ncbi:MAG TPA: hypothetical protein VH331_15620 [Allosphingosinicella sp.]|jgi:hypothetical protein|nr:hypothetical protein [Allosphingosinicella sp.]